MRGDTNEEAQKILISTLKKRKNRQRRGISTFPKNFSNFPSWNRGGKPFLNKFSTGKGEDRGGETLHIFSTLPPLWALLAKTEPPGRKMAVKLSRRPHTLFFLYFCQNSSVYGSGSENSFPLFRGHFKQKYGEKKEPAFAGGDTVFFLLSHRQWHPWEMKEKEKKEAKTILLSFRWHTGKGREERCYREIRDLLFWLFSSPPSLLWQFCQMFPFSFLPRIVICLAFFFLCRKSGRPKKSLVSWTCCWNILIFLKKHKK